ncbi:serine protease inhibitor 7-like [Lycium barbarum]|uniref:serine protease inhibitor 7-like n=1 Tax=Lycium barbarum TaxID=112863 RepID=UPI00293EDE5D|nr:serine protease inhibitor 7-like [Lycium barbarum]
MTKCLFLLSLCLLPIVAFSSTFTSENPIELPTATSDNQLPRPQVLDTNGEALQPGASYRIVSTFRGAAGGDVYLGSSPNSHAPCADGVFRHNSDVGPRGTPVKFITSGHVGPGIFENQLISIQFNIRTTNLCAKYTVWKVGDKDPSVGARLLETGGTIGQHDSSRFTIEKAKAPLFGYRLLYCPSPCPHCPPGSSTCPCPAIYIPCEEVGQVNQNGKRRLALANGPGLTWRFQKV